MIYDLYVIIELDNYAIDIKYTITDHIKSNLILNFCVRY